MNRWKLVAALAVASTFAAGAESVRYEFARVISNEPDAEHGRALFERCTSCHGPTGDGQNSGAVPRIAGQHFRVLARQLVDFRHGRRWDFRMEAIATGHAYLPGLQDVTDVAFYLSRLDRDGSRGVGDGQYVEAGAKIYADRCASCHGENAEGSDVREIPKLGGQHQGYLMRQIYDAVDGRRLPLTRSHRERFAPLDYTEIMGLSDYLSRVGWNAERNRTDPPPQTPNR